MTDGTGGRRFTSDLPASILSAMQRGTMKSTYRGVPFLKSPLDIGLYLQLFSRFLPHTVIEIGTRFGGSALWFADQLSVHGVPGGGRIVSIDIDPQARVTDPRIEFLTGDARSLSSLLPPSSLAQLPRPFLVVEDSSHFYDTSMAVLEFFHPWLKSGEYIVIEDGVLSQMPEPAYRQYEDGPNRAVADFLDRRGSDYVVDTALCDHYGFNATYNPNGWLRRR